MQTSDFNYHLPRHLIAQKPLANRTDSRLLGLNKSSGCLADKRFTDLVDLLHANDVLILNDTKVIPARLFARKQSGGKAEILIERIIDTQQAIAHIRASKSPKADALLTLDRGFECVVVGREQGLFRLRFNGSQSVLEILEQIGHTPLPPYIDRAADETDLGRYQTVFAKRAGAVAAPTAGLHFDRAMLAKIEQKKVAKAFVTLHIGSGTFQPVRVDDLAAHTMHQEYYAVPQSTVDAIGRAKAQNGRVVAIGTTAVRALEAATKHGQLQAACGTTDLFISPGYAFKTVDALLTNFHLPQSTLLMLVAAFAGYDAVMAAYRHAINENYRFFSYGDAMFLSA